MLPRALLRKATAARQAGLAPRPGNQRLTRLLKPAPVEQVRERDGRRSPARARQGGEGREDDLTLGQVNVPVLAAVTAVPAQRRASTADSTDAA
jgi:hypothetical protein